MADDEKQQIKFVWPNADLRDAFFRDGFLRFGANTPPFLRRACAVMPLHTRTCLCAHIVLNLNFMAPPIKNYHNLNRYFLSILYGLSCSNIQGNKHCTFYSFDCTIDIIIFKINSPTGVSLNIIIIILWKMYIQYIAPQKHNYYFVG